VTKRRLYFGGNFVALQQKGETEFRGR
jgi:hypothetical protein